MTGHPLRPVIDRCHGELLPHHLANLTRAHLIVRPFKKRASFPRRAYAVLFRISSGYPPLLGRFPRVTHPSATRQQESKLSSVTVRLACVKHTASVQSEPGSNSSVNFTEYRSTLYYFKFNLTNSTVFDKVVLLPFNQRKILSGHLFFNVRHLTEIKCHTVGY